MKRYKITGRLVLYFSALLIIFSIVIAAAFYSLFARYSLNVYMDEMKSRAATIAGTLSEYTSMTGAGSGSVAGSGSGNGSGTVTGNGSGNGSGTVTGSGSGNGSGIGNGSGNGNGAGNVQGRGGYGAYLKFIGDVARADIWLVDREMNLLPVNSERSPINTLPLPDDAAEVVQRVYQDGTYAVREAASAQTEASITAGARMDVGGEATAVVLLHSHLDAVRQSSWAGMSILAVCLAIALALSIGLSVLMARRFIRPLKRMERVTGELADGNYTCKTNIEQADELGSLAGHIDVLAQRLQAAAAESQKREQQRRDFLSTVSHELRTPVTVLRGSLEAITDGVVTDPEQVGEYHRQMLRETVQLQRMVNDLLELSRLQNPDFVIEKEPMDVLQVLSDSVRAVRPLAMEKRLTTEFEKGVESYVYEGDYGRLRQMFLVVLDNAVKFSAEGGKLQISALQEQKALCITVNDHGIGISAEELPHIFDRFRHKSGEANPTGSGLGLPIAREIALRHGVSLTAESDPVNGTSFRFRFDPELQPRDRSGGDQPDMDH